MAYGVPVISHSDADDQMPEWEAIKPGTTGDHFESNDVDALADSIRTWTRTPFPDPAVKQACIDEIDANWTPSRQRQLIEAAVLEVGVDRPRPT
jgi:hypothetical protein